MADISDNATLSAVAGALSGGVVSVFVARISAPYVEREAIVRGLNDLLDDLVIEAASYWRSVGLDAPAEKRLKYQMERVDLKIQSLQRRDHHSRGTIALNELFDRLDEAVTGGAFETATRRRDVARIGRIKELGVALRVGAAKRRPLWTIFRD